MNSREAGCVFGVGVGPGDPDLMTLKAVKVLQSARVVAYFSAKQRVSNARTIAQAHLRADCLELPLMYPITTEATADPGGYDGIMQQFYDECAVRIAAHLDEGRDVAVLCEGDPFFYGSYMYLHDRLRERYRSEVVPGVASVMAGSARLGAPLVRRDDALSILPGTLSEQDLFERFQRGGAFAIMKLGRNFTKVRSALERSGLLLRALYIERASMRDERIVPMQSVDPETVPYFSLVIVPGSYGDAGPDADESRDGSLCVVGLGPGAAEWISPEAQEALARATDLVGYQPYLDRVTSIAGQRRHGSDNRVELDRARHALQLAQEGRRVCVVSSGDPGIFAMASAVMEAIDGGPPAWRKLDVRIVPGISAMQAAAARAGAPLGHDFCVVSLSDRLKPWEAVAVRLDAAAKADFAIALYNPLSSQRRWQFDQARAIVARYREGRTPVLLARDLGGKHESVIVTDLENVDASQIDMRTIVLIGSSQTRTIAREGAPPLVYTPRSYRVQ